MVNGEIIQNALFQYVQYAARISELEHADVACAFAWRDALQTAEDTLSEADAALLAEADAAVEQAAEYVMMVLAFTPWAAKQPPTKYVSAYWRRHQDKLQ